MDPNKFITPQAPDSSSLPYGVTPDTLSAPDNFLRMTQDDTNPENSANP